jgi:hypothetical protein
MTTPDEIKELAERLRIYWVSVVNDKNFKADAEEAAALLTAEMVLQDDFDITRTTDPVQRAIYWRQRCKSAEGKLKAIAAQLGPQPIAQPVPSQREHGSDAE